MQPKKILQRTPAHAEACGYLIQRVELALHSVA
jgi:hypothetical protein